MHHLASRSVRAVPDAGLTGSRWRLRLLVHAPAPATDQAVVVRVVHTHGPDTTSLVPLTPRGTGRVGLPFDHRRVRYVSVTLADGGAAHRILALTPSRAPYDVVTGPRQFRDNSVT